MVFYVCGCRIVLSYSFVLLVSAALYAGNRRIMWLLLFSALHEAGHLLMLLCLHGRALELRIAFYGFGLVHRPLADRGEELAFLLAGAAVNAACCVLNLHREVNMPLLLLNILPVFPLDGGRALRLLCPKRLSTVLTVMILVLLTAYALWQRQLSLLTVIIYLTVFCINEGLR